MICFSPHNQLHYQRNGAVLLCYEILQYNIAVSSDVKACASFHQTTVRLTLPVFSSDYLLAGWECAWREDYGNGGGEAPTLLRVARVEEPDLFCIWILANAWSETVRATKDCG